MGNGIHNSSQAEIDAANQEKLRASRANEFQGFYNQNYSTPDGKHYYDYANMGELEKAIGHKLTASEKESGIVAPQFGDTSLTDANGNLKQNFTFDPTKSDAYNTLNTQATSTGPTAIAQAQLNAQGIDEGNLQQHTAQQGLSQLAQNQAMLAQTGGLSSGARERGAMASGKNALLQRQQVGMQGNQQRAGIMSNDANLKQNALQSVEGTQLGAQNTNLSNLVGNQQNNALWNAHNYDQQMAAWGAGQTANAQQKAASSSHK